MFVDRISQEGLLQGRWFEHEGKLCAILARTPVPAMKEDDLEVGLFALEVDGKEIALVYGSLEAATHHFLSLLDSSRKAP